MDNRESHIVYFCLGSNLGNRQKNLAEAIKQISNRCGSVQGSSGIYQSISWGYESENEYYNQCLKAVTKLSPDELLEAVLQIEQLLGRDSRGEGYTDRIIDIDILFYDEVILNSDSLVIPHPRIQERKFVLKPMEELDPGFLHPSLQETLKELSAKCKDNSEVKKL